MRYTDMDQGCTVTLEQQFSKCGPTGSICTIWELVRKQILGSPQTNLGQPVFWQALQVILLQGRFENHCWILSAMIRVWHFRCSPSFSKWAIELGSVV